MFFCVSNIFESEVFPLGMGIGIESIDFSLTVKGSSSNDFKTIHTLGKDLNVKTFTATFVFFFVFLAFDRGF